MKLYYAMGTCSHAPHIALREAGLPVTLVRMDMKTHQLDTGGSIDAVNDKGYVPVLELDDGERLTEAAVILQYIADQVPAKELIPRGGMERYRAQEWLNFVATEIHKPYWALFHESDDREKASARKRLGHAFDVAQKRLVGPWAMGEKFTVVDAYLVTVLNWARAGGIDLASWPGLQEYRQRVRERPAVMEALKAEGLLRPR